MGPTSATAFCILTHNTVCSSHYKVNISNDKVELYG